MSRIGLVPLRLSGLGALAAAMVVLPFQLGCGRTAPPTVVVAQGTGDPVAPPIVETLRIARGDTFDALLARAGLEPEKRQAIIDSLQGKFDVRKLRAGTELTLVRTAEGLVESIEYLIDPDHMLQLLHTGDNFSAAVVEVPSTLRTLPVCGTLRGSLFESISQTGEAAELALEMANIFAWDIDFYTDPQENDRFCFLVEKKEYSNGQPPTYGRILAARYENAGTAYDAYLFPDRGGRPQYYSHDGRSLQAAFLRSPMKFEARISSRFSHRRFHPILKRYRPHLGIDYAAPTGTPVQAIASGTVIFSGYSGGAGNLVKIRHAGGFESQYMHLSRRYVRAGQRVQQGQRIGAVGSTGLSTGPHLDFRLRKNGRYVNFERLKPPRLTKLAAAEMPAFTASRDQYAAAMEKSLREATLLQAGNQPPDSSTVVD